MGRPQKAACKLHICGNLLKKLLLALQGRMSSPRTASLGEWLRDTTGSARNNAWTSGSAALTMQRSPPTPQALADTVVGPSPTDFPSLRELAGGPAPSPPATPGSGAVDESFRIVDTDSGLAALLALFPEVSLHIATVCRC